MCAQGKSLRTMLPEKMTVSKHTEGCDSSRAAVMYEPKL